MPSENAKLREHNSRMIAGLEATAKAIHPEHGPCDGFAGGACSECLRRFNALREDKARLDWLEANVHALHYGVDCMVCVRGEDGKEFSAPTWREAIDLARK